MTNGREWILFRSNRIGDGVDTLEGKAFVFFSLKCIRNQFGLFFDLLAKHRVRNLVFRARLQEAEGRIIRHPEFEKRLRRPESAHFLKQSDIAPALDRIMTSFFQRLSNDQDKEMLSASLKQRKAEPPNKDFSASQRI